MNIYISSDESGVFDQANEKVFVYGGLICFSKDEADYLKRHYAKVEASIVKSNSSLIGIEAKASKLTNAEKGHAYRSLNKFQKFAVMVDIEEVTPEVFLSPKHKQRYLDFAYKMVLKKYFEKCIAERTINPSEVEYIIVRCDEHSTATNGRYELREALLNEFKYGTFNANWDIFYPSIFSNLKDVDLSFVNSKRRVDVRAADIVANHFYYLFRTKAQHTFSHHDEKEFIIRLPK